MGIVLGVGVEYIFFSGVFRILLFVRVLVIIIVIKSCFFRGVLKKNSLVIFFLFCDLDDFENRYFSYIFMG